MKLILINILKHIGSKLLMEVLQKSIEELEKRQDNSISIKEVQLVRAMKGHLHGQHA